MSLIRTITGMDLMDAMKDAGRGDSFSIEACNAIVEYYGEFEDSIEIDPVAIDCEFIESKWEDIRVDYCNFDDISAALNERELLEVLNYYTWAVSVENGKILYIYF